MQIVLIVIYLVLGYWATGKTIYANKVVIYQFGQLFIQRMTLGAILGIVLIPWAIIKTLMGR